MPIEMVDRRWMKDLGIEITRSNKAYEKYEVPGDDSNAFNHSIRLVNRTFAFGFYKEEWLKSYRDMNVFLFAEKIIPEVEKKLILDAFRYFDHKLFEWEKPEGQIIRYFTPKEAQELLLSAPVNIEEIETKFRELPGSEPFKEARIIFQERFPWELTQTFDMDDSYKLRARLAAQLVPKQAKLVEED